MNPLIASLKATNFLGINEPAIEAADGQVNQPYDTTMSLLTQAMATFSVGNGALDTSSPFGQHNALAVTAMPFAATGHSHP